MKRIVSIFLSVCLILSLLPFGIITANAATSGYYTYSIKNGGAEITDVYNSISGEVTIPSTLGGFPVTSINQQAFEGCTSLTSITIPDSVTYIGMKAFAGCTSLTSITIPDSVTNIYFSPFDDTAYYNNSSNWVNDVLYIGNHLIKAKTSITGLYQINEGTKAIAAAAFSHCKNLTSITIPDSVTRISQQTFSHCTSLTSISIPDSVTSIGYWAFENCTSLATINIPDNVSSIDNGAFSSCESLTSVTIPNNVTCIDYETFENCTSLTSITIPDSVTSIGYRAFDYCDSLETVYYCGTKEQWNNISIGSDNIFLIGATRYYHKFNNDCDTSCDICGYIRIITHNYQLAYNTANHYEECSVCGDKIKIESHSFENACDTSCDCGYARTITHDYEMAYDETEHYEECSVCGDKIKIESHSFENACDTSCDCGYARTIEHDYEGTYDEINHYEKCTVCGNQTNVESHSFENACDTSCDCGYTRTIDHDYQLQKDDDNHWEECSVCHVKQNTKQHTYDNDCDAECDACGYKRETADHIFDHDCDADCNICGFERIPPLTITGVSSDGVVVIDCIESATTIKIPEIVTYNGRQCRVVGINEEAFKDCNELTSISIASNVTWIGPQAFENCTSLTEINIPDRVTKIEYDAFKNCNKLETITIGDNVTNIDYTAFFGCDSLKEITVGKLNQKYLSKDGALFNKSMTEIITYPKGKSGEYTIPDGVKVIGDYAFYNCDKLTEVTIPNSVVTVSESAFESCDMLATVNMGENVEVIEESAFADCSVLSSIELPKELYTIGDLVFKNCEALKEMKIPADIYQMGINIFYGCNSLEKLIIPKVHTVYIDGIYATNYYNFGSFFGSLSENYLENSTYIPKTLKEVVITNATDIEKNAFYGCESIESITIPDTVTSIGQYAFYGCNNLKTITLPFVGYSSFSDENTHFGYIFGANSFVPSSLKEVIITNETTIHEYAFYKLSSITTLVITEDMVTVGEGAFEECSGLSDVRYSGTEEQANKISIGEYNECLKNATWHYIECDHTYDDDCDTDCNLCGAIRSVAHNPVIQNVLEATCTEDGYTGDEVCSSCDTVIVKGEAVKAQGHDWKEEVEIDKEPTCTEAGSESIHCKVCDAKNPDTITTIGELGHNWSEWAVTTTPTYESEGEEARSCSRCSESETRTLDKLVKEPIENPFVDVKEGEYYFTPVLWAVEKGITSGTSKTTFSPDMACSRAQIVTFLWRAMGKPEPTAGYNPFSDVDVNSYYGKAVLWAVEKGITSGTSKTTFSPDDECTREQIVTFLWRAMGKPEPTAGYNTFSDVDINAYYGKAVLWAVENKVTSGTGNGKFSPKEPCTRGQVVTFLYRTMCNK